MEIEIKQLEPDMAGDFFSYFDNVAFADHPEWSACYCLESHVTEQEEKEVNKNGKDGRRQKAKELILTGVMHGYLAFADGKPVGWCNSDDKKNYCNLCKNKEFWPDKSSDDKVRVAYCFDIAPDYRGNGIASKMLQRVYEDAKMEGYQYVEGYPLKGATGIYQYHGPMRLYEKAGFEVYGEGKEFMIMRKKII